MARLKLLVIHEKINMVVTMFLDFEMEYLGSIPQDEQVSKAIIENTRRKEIIFHNA